MPPGPISIPAGACNSRAAGPAAWAWPWKTTPWAEHRRRRLRSGADWRRGGAASAGRPCACRLRPAPPMRWRTFPPPECPGRRPSAPAGAAGAGRARPCASWRLGPSGAGPEGPSAGAKPGEELSANYLPHTTHHALSTLQDTCLNRLGL